MVPKAKNYSSGDLARSEGWEPGTVLVDAVGVAHVLVAVHKGYVILEDGDGNVTAVDDDLDLTPSKGGRSK